MILSCEYFFSTPELIISWTLPASFFLLAVMNLVYFRRPVTTWQTMLNWLAAALCVVGTVGEIIDYARDNNYINVPGYVPAHCEPQ